MKDKLHAELASLTQTRDTLVKQRTSLKNKINNIMAARGLSPRREQLSSEKGLREVETLPLSPIVMVEIRALVAQIRSLNQTISDLEKTIKQEGEKLPGHKNLKSIKGIGDTSATILLSIIGDIDDFESEGKLASYFGIVPRIRNSNETQHSGRITKRGTKLGRTTLVQCSLIAMRYSEYLQQFYHRIAARRGKGKAIIALAKKFLGIIFATLKNDWTFEDFPNFVIAEAA